MQKPCEAGSAIPQPPVGTGLLPGFFPPGRLLASSPLRGHIWCLPPGLGCRGSSELRPVPHFPSAYPSGWPGSLTPAALHPKAVRNFPAVRFHSSPSSPAANSKHRSLQACPPGVLLKPGNRPSLPPSLLAASDLTSKPEDGRKIKIRSVIPLHTPLAALC